MNWKTIAEKYSKAWSIFREWSYIDTDIYQQLQVTVGAYEKFKSVLPRMLYDFFDDQEIWIDIDHEFGEDWTFTIDEGRTGHNGDDIIYTSRTNAEEVAFAKAFELLEQKLNS